MFLGHDRLATTEIYLNMSPEDAIMEYQLGISGISVLFEKDIEKLYNML